MNDNPARRLAGEIERLAGNGRYRGDEWLRWLTQDVLAGFGKRLDKPWDAYQHERLFMLSGLYAQLVAANPWQDILGPTYMELGSHGQRGWRSISRPSRSPSAWPQSPWAIWIWTSTRGPGWSASWSRRPAPA
jgi:hypothetical protein